MNEDIELLCDKANEYFDSIDFDGRIMLSHKNGASICECKHALNGNKKLFYDIDTRKGYPGKYCPKCGKVYITFDVLSRIISEVKPSQLGINFKTKGWYYDISPKLAYKWTKNSDERAVSICESIIKKEEQAEKRKEEQREKNKEIALENKRIDDRVVVTKAVKRNKNRSLIHFGTTTFIVKSNTFSCGKKGHRLEQVDGIIKVIVRNTGDIKAVLISAGYCKDCDQYFILEEMYDRLIAYGTPLCRIRTIDQKITHREDKFEHYNNESILMGYGYSVSKKDELSDQARHTILAMLMDYDICPKFTILSYLERFINDRKNMSSMIDAIKLWNKDIAFVTNYKKGTLKKQWIDILEIHKDTYKL